MNWDHFINFWIAIVLVGVFVAYLSALGYWMSKVESILSIVLILLFFEFIPMSIFVGFIK